MSRHLHAFRFATALAFLVLVPELGAAQAIRVNGPPPHLPGLAGEDVGAFQISPDGATAVFFADPDEADRFELYSTPVDQGHAWRLLSDPSYAGGYKSLRIGSGRAVYEELSPTYQPVLYAVPLDGSTAPVRLQSTLVAGGAIESYEIEPGGARVIYRADQRVDERFELFSIRSDGSAGAIALVPALVAGGDVTSFRLVPGGGAVVYRADRTTDEKFELWAVPTAGGTPPIRLSGTLAPDSDVTESFELTADGSRVVYTVEASDGTAELWSVGGNAVPVRVSGPLTAGGSVRTPFRLSPDGGTVVYLADQEIDEMVELWAAPVDGSAAPVKLGGTLVPGGDVEHVHAIAAGGERVVYQADELVDGQSAVFSAPISGGPSSLLSDPAAIVSSVVLSGDGRSVVYRGDDDGDGVFELWGVPIEGGVSPVRLNGPLHRAAEISRFEVGFDRVVYQSDERSDELFELWSVPADGSGAPVALNNDLRLHGDVYVGYEDPVGSYRFELTPDGTRALYRADQRVDETVGLWSVPVDRSRAPVALHMPLEDALSYDEVFDFAWAEDGTRLLYGAYENLDRYPQHGVFSASLATFEADGHIPVVRLGTGSGIQPSADGSWAAFTSLDPPCEVEPCEVDLRCAPADGSLPATLLTEAVGGIGPVRFSPDGSRAVYFYGYPSFETYGSALFSVTTDGTDQVMLSVPETPGVEGPHMGDFAVSLDGSLVVFLERHGGLWHLYSVPIDGWAPPLELNDPLFSELQEVSSFRLTPDGASVAFVADPFVQGTFELFLAPIDGSAQPVRLGPPAEGYHYIEPDFRIDSLGERVVYVAEHELWSVPLDPARGDSAVCLSAEAPFGHDVALPIGGHSQFEVAPDATRVVYLAETDQYQRYALFSVPIDGSAAPVPLHPPLAYDEGVDPDGFEISADSSRVVLVADFMGVQERAVFAVPIDGSLDPLQLSGPFVAGGGLVGNTPFAISADGTTVAYLADQLTDDVCDLFGVPIDGSRAARRLNSALEPGGDVHSFAFAPTGNWVAFLAGAWSGNGNINLFVHGPNPPHLDEAKPPAPLR